MLHTLCASGKSQGALCIKGSEKFCDNELLILLSGKQKVYYSFHGTKKNLLKQSFLGTRKRVLIHLSGPGPEHSI